MASSDYYLRQVEASRKKIANLQKTKGDLSKKAAKLQSKIAAASKAANSTKSALTMRSKVKEVESKSRELATTEGKTADVEKKLGAEHKKLSSAEQSLAKEQAREAKKRQKQADSIAKSHNAQLNTIDNRLQDHDRKHDFTMSEIEKLKQLPEEIAVLFLAANPLDQQQLRLDEEVRSIAETIRKSKHRDVVKLHSCWANRPPDVLQAINEFDPTIVHFSGHGSDQDEIVFQDDHGKTKLVSKEAIVQTMIACSGSIRLVFFNTCYSNNQAEAVVKHVDAAIGMNTSVGDDAARIFASQFYSGVGFGHSVEKAFQQAKALLMMESIPEENTPELFVADGLTANEIVLVRPEPTDRID